MTSGGIVTNTAAIELLEMIRRELTDIRRGKHFAQWRPEAVQRLDGLATLPPFRAYASTRIFTGDGGGLVAGETPEDILAAFDHELARNSATYLDVSPVFGVDIDAICELAEGIRIIPASEVSPWWRPHPIHQWMALPNLPTGTCYLTQSYRVEPAFEVQSGGGPSDQSSETSPVATERESFGWHRRCRTAYLNVGA
jgi:hypothetical protein